jgi:hypothetical protein
LYLLAKGQRKSRVIQCADLDSQRFHFGQNILASNLDADALRYCVHLASAIFYLAQSKHNFSLPPFYAQEWDQLTNGSDSNFVCGLPSLGRLAGIGARFLSAKASAKEFVQQFGSLWLDLADRDDFLVAGVSSIFSASPCVFSDRDGTVRVHDAGKVCKFKFSHEQIIVELTTTCNYYYDADAIKEDCITDDFCRPYGSPGANELDGRESPQGNEQIRTKMPDGWATHGGGHGSFHKEGREAGRRSELARGFRGGSYVNGEPGPRQATGNTYAPDGFRRNRRSVWMIATEPYADAHFATFPTALVEPCILAGSRNGDVVLDPFMGSGTVAKVAQSLGRHWVGCELNTDYVAMQKQRAAQMGMAL